jgi:hypothetical protein
MQKYMITGWYGHGVQLDPFPSWRDTQPEKIEAYLASEVDALLDDVRKALYEEWEHAHDAECENMRGCKSFGKVLECYYPKPAVLNVLMERST